jgi:hypothetical protein
MALALPLLAGLAIAPLLGGRWSRLGQVRIRAVPVFFVAIGLQVVAFPFRMLPWHTPDRVAVVLWLCSYALLIVGVAANIRLPGVPAIAAGLFLNLSAILLNGGHMPALPSALRGAGLHFVQSRNSAAMPAPHLAWFVDRWAAPPWVPLANVFSVGDVLIATGGFVLALAATGVFRRRHDNAADEPAGYAQRGDPAAS